MPKMLMIEIKELCFQYQSKTPILKNLSLAVPEGSIYGFLGSNGAGKSTMIRNMLGLLKPQSGKVHLLGKVLEKSVPSIFSQIGSLIEAPSLYPHLNGIDNLKIACHYHKISYATISTTLKKVGLEKESKKKVKHYSMGMKQRLGLALALVHDPKLLLLDEPTNGLDPNGINEVRKVLFRLRDEGKTIVLSSHILSEIEKTASHVGIIKEGSLAFEGTLRQLEQIKSRDQRLILKVNDREKAAEVLGAQQKVTKLQEPHLLSVEIQNDTHIPEIVQKLVYADLKVYEARQVKNDLEQMFLSITSN